MKRDDSTRHASLTRHLTRHVYFTYEPLSLVSIVPLIVEKLVLCVLIGAAPISAQSGTLGTSRKKKESLSDIRPTLGNLVPSSIFATPAQILHDSFGRCVRLL